MSYRRAIFSGFLMSIAPCIGSVLALVSCSAADRTPREETAQVSNELQLSGGSRILSDSNWLGITAVNNYYMKRVAGCAQGNPACQWTYRQGMIVSVSDSSVAIRPRYNAPFNDAAMDSNPLIVSNECTPLVPECSWIWHKGKFLNVADTTFAMYADSTYASNPDQLILRANVSDTNPDGTWTFESAHLGSGADPRLNVYVNGLNGDNTSPLLLGDCSNMPGLNPDTCTWRLTKGMIVSNLDWNYAANAWGGALPGNSVRAVNACDTGNPSCTWTLSAWHDSAWGSEAINGNYMFSDDAHPGVGGQLTSMAVVPSDSTQGGGAKPGATLKITTATSDIIPAILPREANSAAECSQANIECSFIAAQAPAPATAPSSQADWTIIYIIFGDGDFSCNAITALGRVSRQGASDKVNVITVLDTPRTYNPAAARCPLYGGQGVVLKSNQNSDPTVLGTLGDQSGEADMADPAFMGNELAWIVQQYQANHYAIITKSHGSGWGGVGWDDTSSQNPQFLPIVTGQYGQVLQTVNAQLARQGQGKIDIIGYNACLMGMWEVATANAPYAKYMVADEHEEFGDPWGFVTFLPYLANNSGLSGRDLSSQMVADFYPTQTAAATDLGSPLTSLSAAVSNLGNALNKANLYGCINDARASVLRNDDFRLDLGMIAQALYDKCADSNVKSAAQAVLAGIPNAVFSRHDAVPPDENGNGTGLTIWFPRQCSSPNASNEGWANYQDVNAPWNLTGNGWSQFTRGFAPQPSDTPAAIPQSSLSAASTNSSSVTLTWQPSTSPGVTYNVLRGTSPGVYGSMIATGITTTTYTDTALTAGTKYYYAVVAARCSINSPNSTEVSATPGFLETESLSVGAKSTGDNHVTVIGSNYSGGKGTNLQSNATNDYVTYVTPNVTAAGTYRVDVQFKKGNNEGKVQLSMANSLNGTYTNIGAAQDTYASSNSWVSVNLGNYSISQTGPKYFKFTVTGKNSSSSSYQLFLDYIKLTKL